MYLRFGEIPENEQSINWWKVRLSDQEAFSWAYKAYGYEEALNCIRNLDEALEDGVSAFEIDENGNPVLGNDALKATYESYLSRKDRKVYLVDGDEIGKGADNEPLLKNVRILKEVK